MESKRAPVDGPRDWVSSAMSLDLDREEWRDGVDAVRGCGGDDDVEVVAEVDGSEIVRDGDGGARD